MSEHARGVRATVRLLANTAAISEFLPGSLGPWLAAHPRIDIDLSERPSSEIVKAVAVSDAVDRLVAVMPRTHPMAGERRIAFSQLLGEDHIGFAGALQQHIDDHAARAGHRLQPRVHLRTFEGICRMAADGVGFGIIPESAARRCRRTMPIAFVRLSDAWATRRLLLCSQAIKGLQPITRQLLEHLSLGQPARTAPLDTDP